MLVKFALNCILNLHNNIICITRASDAGMIFKKDELTCTPTNKMNNLVSASAVDKKKTECESETMQTVSDTAEQTAVTNEVGQMAT